jgi:hypothetical protein
MKFVGILIGMTDFQLLFTPPVELAGGSGDINDERQHTSKHCICKWVKNHEEFLVMKAENQKK